MCDPLRERCKSDGSPETACDRTRNKARGSGRLQTKDVKSVAEARESKSDFAACSICTSEGLRFVTCYLYHGIGIRSCSGVRTFAPVIRVEILVMISSYSVEARSKPLYLFTACRSRGPVGSEHEMYRFKRWSCVKFAATVLKRLPRSDFERYARFTCKKAFRSPWHLGQQRNPKKKTCTALTNYSTWLEIVL